MYRSQQLDSLLPNSWLASDKLEMDDGEILLCTENVCSSPIRSSAVVRLIFMIVIGLAQPTPSAVILGTQLPVSSGQIGSYQGGKLEAPYINRVILKENDANVGVAYSILEAYNGIREGKTSAEEETVVKRKTSISSNTIVYGSLGAIGVVVMSISAIVSFVKPLFDVNVAYVLLPLSLAYLAMIGADYWARGRDNALS